MNGLKTQNISGRTTVNYLPSDKGYKMTIAVKAIVTTILLQFIICVLFLVPEAATSGNIGRVYKIFRIILLRLEISAITNRFNMY